MVLLLRKVSPSKIQSTKFMLSLLQADNRHKQGPCSDYQQWKYNSTWLWSDPWLGVFVYACWSTEKDRADAVEAPDASTLLVVLTSLPSPVQESANLVSFHTPKNETKAHKGRGTFLKGMRAVCSRLCLFTCNHIPSNISQMEHRALLCTCNSPITAQTLAPPCQTDTSLKALLPELYAYIHLLNKSN